MYSTEYYVFTTTYHLLFTAQAYYLLTTPYSPPPAHYSLLTTPCSLLTAHYSLLTTHYGSASLEARKKLLEELKTHPFNYAAMQAIQADFCKVNQHAVSSE